MTNELYVQNEDKMVYRVELKRQGGQGFYFLIELELVCGWDYVAPDHNDIQGYVSADRFIDDVQYESLTFYPMDETMVERLEDDGYKVVEMKDLSIEHLVQMF